MYKLVKCVKRTVDGGSVHSVVAIVRIVKSPMYEGGLRDVEIGITADCGSVLCSVADMVCVTVQCCRVGCEVCKSCGVLE